MVKDESNKMPHQHLATDRTLATVAVLVTGTVVFHFAWEMTQAAAFVPFPPGVTSGTLRCFQAALGDLFIASGTFAITAVLFRRWAWPVIPAWRRAGAVWIVLGLVVTVMFERWALASGRWQYGDGMPVVLGIGLWPLLQWVVIPLLTLWFFRTRLRRRSKEPRFS